LVTLRVRLTQRAQPPRLASLAPGGPDSSAAWLEDRLVVVEQQGEKRLIPFYRGEDLRPGNQIQGPAIVARSDTTILIGVTDHALVDGYGNLWIEVGP
jgi:N-methylhydantoinase A/oxoprolinase/acetone carboxylase beta subunit